MGVNHYEDLERVINTDGDMSGVLKRLATRYREKAEQAQQLAGGSDDRDAAEETVRYYGNAARSVEALVEPEGG